jgi:hypothetical protein
MRNRYYSVETGRFLTRDPIGVWGDLGNLGNEYGYAWSRPLVVGDLIGLQGSLEQSIGQAIAIGMYLNHMSRQRDGYAAEVASIKDPADTKARSDIKRKWRDRTVVIARQYLDWRYPIDECGRSIDRSTGSLKPQKAGSANKANKSVTQTGIGLGLVGKSMTAVGVVGGVWNACTSENPLKASAEVVGATSGSLMLGSGSGWLGAFLGGLLGGPLGAVVGAASFGTAGSLAGSEIGGAAGGAFVDALQAAMLNEPPNTVGSATAEDILRRGFSGGGPR